MKRLLLIVIPLLLSVGISQNKVNINNLIEYGDKMFKTDDDKPYTGMVFDLDKSSGNKILEGWYKDGLRNGKWNKWYENGQKSGEGTFKDGKSDGVWTYWDENGQKSREGTYKNEMEDGLWTGWYENGQKRTEGTFKEGKEEGLWTQWYENGQKEKEGNYKDGYREGKWTNYGKDGSPKEDSNYKDRKLFSPLYFGNIDDIHRVIISQGDKTMEFLRNGMTWVTKQSDSLIIVENKIQDIVERLLVVEKTYLMTNKEEKFKNFGVDNSNGRHLIGYDNEDKELFHYILSENRYTYQTGYKSDYFYVRKHESLKVFRTNSTVF